MKGSTRMTKIKDIAFVGIRLDKESKKFLLHKVAEMPNVDSYSKFFCDHVTLEFGEDITFSSLSTLGEEKELTVGSCIIGDEKAAYLPVLLLDHPYSHITIATNAMTPPVYSGEHYRKCDLHLSFNNLNGAAKLKGVVSAYMKDGSIVTRLI